MSDKNIFYRLTIGLLLRFCFLLLRIGVRRDFLAGCLFTCWYEVGVCFKAILQGRESIQHLFCGHHFLFRRSVVDFIERVFLYWASVGVFDVLACLERKELVESKKSGKSFHLVSRCVISQAAVWMILEGWMSHDDALVDGVNCAPEREPLTAGIFDLKACFGITHDTIMSDAAVVAAEIDDCRFLKK